MNPYLLSVTNLKRAGWTVKLHREAHALPVEVKARYAWLPEDVERFLGGVEAIVSPEEKAWLLGYSDYAGSSSSAFAWDEFERLSLNAADQDLEWVSRIRQFWDFHFPVMLSVKSGYAYFAIRRPDLCIVGGEEPEFEEAKSVAASFHQFLNLLAHKEEKLARWV
jgi:hypothetical protein